MYYVVPVKSKVKSSQNFVAFSEYMNFKSKNFELDSRILLSLIYNNFCQNTMMLIFAWVKKRCENSELIFREIM